MSKPTGVVKKTHFTFPTASMGLTLPYMLHRWLVQTKTLLSLYIDKTVNSNEFRFDFLVDMTIKYIPLKASTTDVNFDALSLYCYAPKPEAQAYNQCNVTETCGRFNVPTFRYRACRLCSIDSRWPNRSTAAGERIVSLEQSVKHLHVSWLWVSLCVVELIRVR